METKKKKRLIKDWEEEAIEYAESEAIEEIASHIDDMRCNSHIKAHAILACVFTEMIRIIDERPSDYYWCIEQLNDHKEWLKQHFEAKTKKLKENGNK